MAVPTTPLSQKEMFEEVTEKFPDVLRKCVYCPPPIAKPLRDMSLAEKQELFLDALREMTQGVAEGKNAADVAYDNNAPRLFSFGLQPMWEVCVDKQASRLLGTESLLALHATAWGVYPILEVLENLLANDLTAYLQFKTLEIQAAVAALERYPSLPCISVNLRPSEWMMEEIQTTVLAASHRVPKRMIFELTEYTEDVHFKRFFGEEGPLGQRLTTTLLPVLRRLKEQGATLLADDLLPGSIYHFDSEASRGKARRISETHATECSIMLSEEWSSLFNGVKIGLEWVVHAMAISKHSGEQYAAVPLYLHSVKDNPRYVAAVTDSEVPAEEADQQAALSALQSEAKRTLKATLKTIEERSFEILTVFEGTVPGSCAIEWGLENKAKEQGGMFFEARFPPSWFFGVIRPPPEAQLPKRTSTKRRLPME